MWLLFGVQKTESENSSVATLSFCFADYRKSPSSSALRFFLCQTSIVMKISKYYRYRYGYIFLDMSTYIILLAFHNILRGSDEEIGSTF